MNQRLRASGRVRVLLACLLLAALASTGCDRKPAEPEKAARNDAVPVEAVAVSKRPMTARYTGVATLEADAEADVVAKTSGVLLKLLVEEGMNVKAGQALARLDDENARLNLARSEATLRKLEADYRRSSEMFARKLLSVEQNDKIRYDLETQRAIYDMARLELSYTTIVAPIGGVISRRMVKEGNFIKLNDALFRIDNFDPLLAVLNVPERDLHTLSPKQSVLLRVDALPGEKFVGAIQRISPVVDSGTGTFRVTCEFRDATQRLKSGMFGRLEITYGEHADALTMPRAALIEEDGETAVFVVAPGSSIKPADEPAKPGDGAAATPKAEESRPADGTPAEKPPEWVAQRKLITVGFSDGEYVEILDGLAIGDKVITIGRSAVRDGTSVQVLEAVQ